VGKQVPVGPGVHVDEKQHGGVHEIAPDLAYQRLAIVNVVFYGRPGAGDRQWVLIDAGVMGTTSLIAGASESGTLKKTPSIPISRSPLEKAQGSPAPARGRANRSKSRRKGATPSRWRTLHSEERSGVSSPG
jgi:hypothetical protein